jgi:hypothetical protein
MPDKSEQKTAEAKSKSNSLELRVYRLHNTFLKMGTRIGGSLIRLTAFYCLYKVFSNGGAESLAYVSYEHMLNAGKLEWEKRNGTQGRMRKK